jgi:hypothetical protein
MSVLSALGKGILKFIPGVSGIVGAIETVGEVAEAVGGETGKKINDGIKLVTDGLQEANAQPMTPEQQYKLEQAGMRHKERMAGIDLEDTEGGRNLAKAEIASNDEYVRQTRPKLLRVFGWATVWLLFLVVAVSTWVVFGMEQALTRIEADFLMYVLISVAGLIAQVFLFMFRIYVSKRTAEKLGQVGLQPETLLDKMGKVFGAKQ